MGHTDVVPANLPLAARPFAAEVETGSCGDGAPSTCEPHGDDGGGRTWLRASDFRRAGRSSTWRWPTKSPRHLRRRHLIEHERRGQGDYVITESGGVPIRLVRTLLPSPSAKRGSTGAGSWARGPGMADAFRTDTRSSSPPRRSGASPPTSRRPAFSTSGAGVCLSWSCRPRSPRADRPGAVLDAATRSSRQPARSYTPARTPPSRRTSCTAAWR